MGRWIGTPGQSGSTWRPDVLRTDRERQAEHDAIFERAMAGEPVTDTIRERLTELAHEWTLEKERAADEAEARENAKPTATDLRDRLRKKYPPLVTGENACPRCEGTGHYQNYGTCYRCGGSGRKTGARPPTPEEALARLKSRPVTPVEIDGEEVPDGIETTAVYEDDLRPDFDEAEVDRLPRKAMVLPVETIYATKRWLSRTAVEEFLQGHDEPLTIVRVEGRNYVWDGHARLEAALVLGERSVPVELIEISLPSTAAWDERQHPRADDGKFTDKEGGTAHKDIGKVLRPPRMENQWEEKSRAEYLTQNDFRYNPDPVQRAGMLWQLSYASNALVANAIRAKLAGDAQPRLDTGGRDWHGEDDTIHWTTKMLKDGYTEEDLLHDVNNAADIILEKLSEAEPIEGKLLRGEVAYDDIETLKDRYYPGDEIQMRPRAWTQQEDKAHLYALEAQLSGRKRHPDKPHSFVMIEVDPGSRSVAVDRLVPQRGRPSSEHITGGTFQVMDFQVEDDPDPALYPNLYPAPGGQVGHVSGPIVRVRLRHVGPVEGGHYKDAYPPVVELDAFGNPLNKEAMAAKVAYTPKKLLSKRKWGRFTIVEEDGPFLWEIDVFDAEPVLRRVWLNPGTPEGGPYGDYREAKDYEDAGGYTQDHLIAYINVTPEGEVDMIGVKPEYRGQGIGSFLLNEAIKRFGKEKLHGGGKYSPAGAGLWKKVMGHDPSDFRAGWQARTIWGAKTGMASDAWKTIPGLYFEVKKNCVLARTPELDEVRELVGALYWYRDGEINMVTVQYPYRRMGLATEMLRRAREVRPDIRHSDRLSDEGYAWSQVTAKAVTKCAGVFDFYEWEWKLQGKHGVGRKLTRQKEAQDLAARVCRDYGIDPESVTVTLKGWEGETVYDFNTRTAEVRIGFNVNHAWGLLHEMGHVILFHRGDPDHQPGWGTGYGGHHMALATLLAELLAKYTRVRIDPTSFIKTDDKPVPAGRARVAAFTLTEEQTAKLRKIRGEDLGPGRQLTICGKVSADIERTFGWPKVVGWYEGPDGSGREIAMLHAWNRLPNGQVLDATADQMGHPGIWITDSSRHRPFTEREQEFVRRWMADNYGQEPDAFDFGFMDEYLDGDESIVDEMWKEGAATTPDQVRQLADQFATRVREYEDAMTADGACILIENQFNRFCQQHPGISYKSWYCVGALAMSQRRLEYLDYYGDRPERMTHTASCISLDKGKTWWVVDFTYRQFDETSPWPLVEAEADYLRRFTTHEVFNLRTAAKRPAPPGVTFKITPPLTPANYPERVMVIAERDGEIVGNLDVWREWFMGRWGWYVYHAQVAESARQQGIARAMCEHLKAESDRIINKGTYLLWSAFMSPQGKALAESMPPSWNRVKSGPDGFGGVYRKPLGRTAALSTQEVYRLQGVVRRFARKLVPGDVKSLASRILGDHRWPDPWDIQLISHPKGPNNSGIAVMADDEYGIPLEKPLPVLALGENMRDEMTVIHECAHFIRNGRAFFESLQVRPADMEMHDQEWMDTYARLMQKYASNDLWIRWARVFGYKPSTGEKVAKTAAGGKFYRGFGVKLPAGAFHVRNPYAPIPASYISGTRRVGAKTAAFSGPIYRGYKVVLPEPLMEQVQRLLQMPMEEEERGQHQKIGRILVDWLQQNHWDRERGLGLGRHWTRSRQFADAAAMQGGAYGGVGIILEATFNPADEEEGFVYTTPQAHAAEEEVTLKPGSRVTVTKVILPAFLWQIDRWMEEDFLDRPIQAIAGSEPEVIEMGVEEFIDRFYARDLPWNGFHHSVWIKQDGGLVACHSHADYGLFKSKRAGLLRVTVERGAVGVEVSTLTQEPVTAAQVSSVAKLLDGISPRQMYFGDDEVRRGELMNALRNRMQKAAGPGSGVIPAHFRAREPGSPAKARRVMFDRAGLKDLQDIDPALQKAVKRAITTIEAGDGARIMEPKSRGSLRGTWTVDLDEDARMLLYLHTDGNWHVPWVGPHHDYDEAERRMSAAAKRVHASKVRLYHGTNQAALDSIRRDGEFRPADHRRIAREIEDRYGLTRDSVWESSSYGFNRGFRAGDQNVYFTTDLRTATEYATIGSEAINDGLNGAYLLLHPDALDEEGNYRPGAGQTKQHWVREETKKHYAPVVLTVEVPWEVYLDSIADRPRWATVPDPEPEDVQGGVTLPAPIPASWIVGVQKIAVSIESPDEKSVTMWHGTTQNAWEQIKRNGFATPIDPMKLCHQLENEFGLPRGSIWKQQQWSKRRRKEKTTKDFYATIDRKVAEGYATAGSAPLYDALKAAYIALFPERVEYDYFGVSVRGLHPWLKKQIEGRGGGPVVIEFDMPESLIRSSKELQPYANIPWKRILESLSQVDALRLDGVSWRAVPNLVKYVVAAHPFEQPNYIKTQNSKKNGSKPDSELTDFAISPR